MKPYKPRLAHTAGAYPSFRSMKRLGVFLLPLWYKVTKFTILNKPQFFCPTPDIRGIAEEPQEIFEGIPLLSLVLACHRLVHLLVYQ